MKRDRNKGREGKRSAKREKNNTKPGWRRKKKTSSIATQTIRRSTCAIVSSIIAKVLDL